MRGTQDGHAVQYHDVGRERFCPATWRSSPIGNKEAPSVRAGNGVTCSIMLPVRKIWVDAVRADRHSIVMGPAVKRRCPIEGFAEGHEISTVKEPA
jgi:hypothetical protein